MKVIIFTDAVECANKVYSSAKTLKSVDFGERVYTKRDLGKVNFSEVVYMFSTWGMPCLTESEIKTYFPNLRYLFYSAGSVQCFARPFLNLGIRVCSAWKANAVPVIEYAVSQILLANKGFYQLTRLIRKNRESAEDFFTHFKGNYRAKVGILGDGAIGGGVIDELLRHNLNVFVYSITMTSEQAKAKGVRLAGLEEIFSTCDVISNHLANNEETKGIINGKLLLSLPDYATFINTGRGAQVDESALLEVLKKNRTLTAVLDVTYPELPERKSELYTLDNVFLTPHIAGSSGFEIERLAVCMVEEYTRIIKNEPPIYEITKKMLEKMA